MLRTDINTRIISYTFVCQVVFASHDSDVASGSLFHSKWDTSAAIKLYGVFFFG